jgi:phage-related protein
MPVQGLTGCTYDGVHCGELGLSLVGITTNSGGSGLYQENFLSSRSIVEIEIKRRKWQRTPYFQYVQRVPIELDLVFWFRDGWGEEQLRAVGRWLDQDYYKELVFDDKEMVFYALLDGQPTITHSGNNDGYITVHMRCNSPYAFSRVIESKVYDLSNNKENGTTIQFTNSGDLALLPEISLVKVGDGDVSIINKTNGNLTFTFTELKDGEDLYIHCEKETIVTNLPNMYRYGNFSGDYMEIVRGINQLQVIGNCKLQFRYQMKFLQ